MIGGSGSIDTVSPAQEGIAVPGGDGAGYGKGCVACGGGLGFCPVGFLAAVGVVGQGVVGFLFASDMDGESDYVVVPIIIAGNLNIATTPIAVAIGEISMKVIIECQGNSCGAWLCSSVVKFQTRPLLITSEVTGVCQGKFTILQDAGIGQCVAYRGTDLIRIRNIFGQHSSTVVTCGGQTWQSLINTCLTNIFLLCYQLQCFD